MSNNEFETFAASSLFSPTPPVAFGDNFIVCPANGNLDDKSTWIEYNSYRKYLDTKSLKDSEFLHK